MTLCFDKLLATTDRVCDYVPIVSTVTNLTDLFLKYVVIPFMNKPAVINNPYYRHIDVKSWGRCAVLFVPLIGNIIIAIYDLVNPAHHNSALAVVQRNGVDLAFLDGECQNNEDIVAAAVTNNGLAVQFASPRLKDSLRIGLYAVQENGSALQYLSPNLKNNVYIVRAAIANRSDAIQFASPGFQQELSPPRLRIIGG